MTDKEYQKAIPPWCYYQTLEQHKEQLMLCWQLVGFVKRKEKITEYNCQKCEFYTEKLSDTIVRDRY